MALGTHLAGFRHLLVNEIAPRAVETLHANGERRGGWGVTPGDVRAIDWAALALGPCDLLAAGAPCQPFSIGGRHQGTGDDRNMFPEVFRAVRALRPRAVMVENVRGLLRTSFGPYLDYIHDQLRWPHIAQRPGEAWERHHARITRTVRAGDPSMADAYELHVQLLNTADYGIPQRRQRIVMVALRRDQDAAWTFPAPTHSGDVLLHEQETGKYWCRHDLESRDVHVPVSRRAPMARDVAAGLAPWRTLRETIAGMPDPVEGEDTPGWHAHRGVPGARLYKGHTGNALDRPAKTIKAGVHGVPGGEHILLRDDGSFRYLTVRECARIQTFPDDHTFAGPRSEAMRQIGNAVPVELARVISASIAGALGLADSDVQPVRGRRSVAAGVR